MFVRFRQAKSRLQASLIQTRRADGRVRHEHFAMLGTFDAPASVGGRLGQIRSHRLRVPRRPVN
jgi:hypothetical protein